ncbi:Pentatricopeptide repeat-containing protein [Nymphaea thermarum]|nr:Pentatricopeptide repeat-containing protein [Nymphaea thermarum]
MLKQKRPIKPFLVLPSSQNPLWLIVSELNSLVLSATCKQDVQRLHACLVVNGLQSHCTLSTKLLQRYSQFGDLLSAHLVFNTIHHLEQKPFIWNVMLRGYMLNNQPEKVLHLYSRMLVSFVRPDGFTFTSLLKACAALVDPGAGSYVHGHALVNGYGRDAFVVTTLIDMYAKCGKLVDACKLFEERTERDVTMWNSMISGLMLNGRAMESLEVFSKMRKLGNLADSVTATAILSASARLGCPNLAKESHAFVLRCGFISDIMVTNSLMDMYCKCLCVDLACKVFRVMSMRDCASWNVMISGVFKSDGARALGLFHGMILAGFKPTACTILTVLPVCASFGAHKQGKEIHGYIVRSMPFWDVRLETALVDMYAKCNHIGSSEKIFKYCAIKDLVLWNAMLTGYVMNSCWHNVLRLFGQLQLMAMRPDSVTLHCLLISLESLQLMKCVGSVHCFIIRHGFAKDSLLMYSLVFVLVKQLRIKHAHDWLRIHCEQDPVPWNVLLAGLEKAGHSEETLVYFDQMLRSNVKFNSVTMLCLLSACAHLASPSKGKSIHGLIVRTGLHTDAFVCTSLIKMYAKCGSLSAARLVFSELAEKDIVSWSVAISAYGVHGFGPTSLQLFKEMNTQNMCVDHVGFVEILSACAHSGLVEEGWQCFESMIRDHSLVPKLEHYGCMVDLLGRAGHLSKAEELISKMPVAPDPGIWGALFGACAVQGNVEMGERVFQQLMRLEPDKAQNYVMMSNIYAGAELQWGCSDLSNAATAETCGYMVDVRFKTGRNGLKPHPATMIIDAWSSYVRLK